MPRIEVKTKFTGPIWTDKGIRIVRQELRRTMVEMVAIGETQVAEKTPVGATGILRAGITGIVKRHNFGVIRSVGPGAVYAPIQELGRRPGSWPPVDAILLWVKRKLRVPNPKQVAYLVGRKIARRGYAGNMMFAKTERQMKGRVNRAFREAVLRIEKRLSG